MVAVVSCILEGQTRPLAAISHTTMIAAHDIRKEKKAGLEIQATHSIAFFPSSDSLMPLWGSTVIPNVTQSISVLKAAQRVFLSCQTLNVNL